MMLCGAVAHGRMGDCLHGRVGAWGRGCMGAWAHGCMPAWAHACRGWQVRPRPCFAAPAAAPRASPAGRAPSRPRHLPAPPAPLAAQPGLALRVTRLTAPVTLKMDDASTTCDSARGSPKCPTNAMAMSPSSTWTESYEIGSKVWSRERVGLDAGPGVARCVGEGPGGRPRPPRRFADAERTPPAGVAGRRCGGGRRTAAPVPPLVPPTAFQQPRPPGVRNHDCGCKQRRRGRGGGARARRLVSPRARAAAATRSQAPAQKRPRACAPVTGSGPTAAAPCGPAAGPRGPPRPTGGRPSCESGRPARAARAGPAAPVARRGVRGWVGVGGGAASGGAPRLSAARRWARVQQLQLMRMWQRAEPPCRTRRWVACALAALAQHMKWHIAGARASARQSRSRGIH